MKKERSNKDHRDYEEILKQIDKLVHKYNQRENIKRCYGLDFPLSYTEIHVIDDIGRNAGIGVKELANKKGVTEGAISQMIKKLIEKGLVKKEISKESEAKVELTLTDQGLICYKEHSKYHKKENVKWYEIFDEMDESDYQKTKILLQRIENTMDEKEQ